jgi:hypothetical protein
VDYESGLLKIGETSKQAKNVVDQEKRKNLVLTLLADLVALLEE